MKKKLISLSFKQIVQIVGPLAIIGFFTCLSFTRIISDLNKARCIDRATTKAEAAANAIMGEFQAPLASLNDIVSVTSETQDFDIISILLRQFASQYDTASYYWTTVTPLPQGGTLIMSYDWTPPDKSWDQSTRPWYIGAKAAQGEVYCYAYLNVRTNAYCVSFTKAVYNSKHEMVGITGFDIGIDGLTDAIKDIQISPNGTLCVIDEKGQYVTNENASFIMDGKHFYFDPLGLSFDEANDKYFSGGDAHIDKNRYYVAKQIGITPWFVAAYGPMSDFTGTTNFWAMFIAGVVILLILGNVAYNAYIQTKMNIKEARVGEQLITEVQSLVVASKENAATSQDQSAAVKEIVATMTDNNALSENISKKITDVSSVAQKTSSDVSDGVSYLAENVQKLREIADANTQTIEGIKALGGKIENIWDIVTLINSVADQAKIIAFNAELEASSAGEAGKNFHIVATEIRRLADGIIDGTKEIKERITEIQQSSDRLVLASESGTEKINEGVAGAASLSERFESIKNASEVTATSASDITTIIQQQSTASEQILITLKQIAAGVENFTAATENISTTSQNLKSIAEGLNTRSEEQS
ncbi:MAG: hypothetical protein IJ158_10325 [Treponema sp.]|nr:hypothetical protein [Treponema sp.]